MDFNEHFQNNRPSPWYKNIKILSAAIIVYTTILIWSEYPHLKRITSSRIEAATKLKAETDNGRIYFFKKQGPSIDLSSVSTNGENPLEVSKFYQIPPIYDVSASGSSFVYSSGKDIKLKNLNHLTSIDRDLCGRHLNLKVLFLSTSQDGNKIVFSVEDQQQFIPSDEIQPDQRLFYIYQVLIKDNKSHLQNIKQSFSVEGSKYVKPFITSEDGQYVSYFSYPSTEKMKVCRFLTENSMEEKCETFNGNFVGESISPDGDHIAYFDNGNMTFNVLNLKNSKKVTIQYTKETDIGKVLKWSNDSLYISMKKENVFQIHKLSFENGLIEQLLSKGKPIVLA